MGCSTSKLQPEEQVEAAEPAKAATGGRRGFGSELFGRGRRRNNKNAGGSGRGDEQQQGAERRKGGAGGRELARSPSFLYYCDDFVVAGAADERKGKERR